MYCIRNNLLIQMSKHIYIILYNEYSFTTLQFLPYYFMVASDMPERKHREICCYTAYEISCCTLDQCFSNGGTCTTGGKQKVNWRSMKLFEN